MLQGLFRFGVKLFNITLLSKSGSTERSRGNKAEAMSKKQDRRGQVTSPALASCLYKQIGPG